MRGSSPLRPASPNRAPAYTPRRPDSPLRQSSPMGKSANVAYGASPGRSRSTAAVTGGLGSSYGGGGGGSGYGEHDAYLRERTFGQDMN